MKIYLILFIFLGLIYNSFLLIPIWDLKSSSINLVSPIKDKAKIKIYDKDVYNCHTKLTKEITLNEEINYIKIDDDFKIKTEWDDIESSYYFDGAGTFICPKGRYFMNEFNGKEFIEKKPENFNDGDNEWELICYYNRGWMFQGFLNRKTITKLYTLRIDYKLIYWKSFEIENGLFDFIWTTDSYEDIYYMIALLLKGSMIYLERKPIKISGDDEIKIRKASVSKPLYYNSTYTHAYFDKENLFYWMSSNTTKDFKSGYSTKKADVWYSSLDYDIQMNDKSPFYFLKNVTINKLNMIRNTRFVYYEIIYNQTINEIYRGIIDIVLNKIIFNTNEHLTKFKVLTNYSMLAYINESVYEICAIKDIDRDKCIKKCPYDTELVLDTEKGNYCSSTKNCDNYILKPYDICIKECNTMYFASYNDICGLCKDLFPDSKEFKVINKSECLESKPNNTFYINEELKIVQYCSSNCKYCSNFEQCLECEDNYKLEDGKCFPKICFFSCQECFKMSIDENDQQCRSCKKNFYYLEEKLNCLSKCPDGYFANDSYCSKCHPNCVTCKKGPEEFEDEINENCESCQSNKYLIKAKGYPRNCVIECPNGTNISDNMNCKFPRNTRDIILSYVFIIFTILLLIILFFFMYRMICCQKNLGVDNLYYNNIAEPSIN